MAHGGGKNSGKLAKRYARALFEVTPIPEVEQVLTSLNLLSEIWRDNKDLRATLINPGISLENRFSIAKEIAQTVSAQNSNLKNLLELMVTNKRLPLIPEIAEHFSNFVDHLRNATTLEITSAFELTPSEKGEYEQRIRRDFGDLAKINWDVDSTLIGGMIIKSGDRLIDSSVRGSLEKMTAQLIS